MQNHKKNDTNGLMYKTETVLKKQTYGYWKDKVGVGEKVGSFRIDNQQGTAV